MMWIARRRETRSRWWMDILCTSSPRTSCPCCPSMSPLSSMWAAPWRGKSCSSWRTPCSPSSTIWATRTSSPWSPSAAQRTVGLVNGGQLPASTWNLRQRQQQPKIVSEPLPTFWSWRRLVGPISMRPCRRRCSWQDLWRPAGPYHLICRALSSFSPMVSQLRAKRTGPPSGRTSLWAIECLINPSPSIASLLAAMLTLASWRP